MVITPIERKIRASLPVIRFMQATMPLPLANWFIKKSVARLKLDAAVTRKSVIADGVPCEWITPGDSSTDRVLLYLYGGGFVFGLSHLHLKMGAYLAQAMGIRLLIVDYRLAPDHPFPDALDDCAAVYRWLLKQDIPAQHIGVAGDSAGGNLTITLSMKLREAGDPLPAAAACLSPVTDLTNREKRYEGFKDPLLPIKAVKLYTRSYLGESDPCNPLISPVFGSLDGLPPLLLHAGEDEYLMEDAVRIARLAESAGVNVRLEIYPRMWHVWQLNLELPQAIQSLEEIARFFIEHLGIGLSRSVFFERP
jgi:acetyl esterase/lipase